MSKLTRLPIRRVAGFPASEGPSPQAQASPPSNAPIGGSLTPFWVEPSADASDEELAALPPAQMAAVFVKGFFAIYHLSREFAEEYTAVPSYLVRFAWRFEKPIIPAAETLWERHFHDSAEGKLVEVPFDLGVIGLSTADDLVVATAYAEQLHALLRALAGQGDDAQTTLAGICGRGRHRNRELRLASELLAMYRAWADRRARLRSV